MPSAPTLLITTFSLVFALTMMNTACVTATSSLSCGSCSGCSAKRTFSYASGWSLLASYSCPANTVASLTWVDVQSTSGSMFYLILSPDNYDNGLRYLTSFTDSMFAKVYSTPTTCFSSNTSLTSTSNKLNLYARCDSTISSCSVKLRMDAVNCYSIVSCQVSSWSNVGSCSATCDGGVQSQTRTITTIPAYGGTSCPSLSQTVSCNTQSCPVTTTPITLGETLTGVVVWTNPPTSIGLSCDALCGLAYDTSTTFSGGTGPYTIALYPLYIPDCSCPSILCKFANTSSTTPSCSFSNRATLSATCNSQSCKMTSPLGTPVTYSVLRGSVGMLQPTLTTLSTGTISRSSLTSFCSRGDCITSCSQEFSVTSYSATNTTAQYATFMPDSQDGCSCEILICVLQGGRSGTCISQSSYAAFLTYTNTLTCFYVTEASDTICTASYDVTSGSAFGAYASPSSDVGKISGGIGGGLALVVIIMVVVGVVKARKRRAPQRQVVPVMNPFGYGEPVINEAFNMDDYILQETDDQGETVLETQTGAESS